MPLSDDQITAAWKRYHTQVMNVVDAIMDDPLQALAHDIQKVEERPGIGEKDAPPDSERLCWTRGAAEKIIPKAFDWEITKVMGGRFYLLFKGYKPDRDRDLET
jgi:hypothetical protein